MSDETEALAVPEPSYRDELVWWVGEYSRSLAFMFAGIWLIALSLRRVVR